MTCHQCGKTGHLQRACKHGKRVTKSGKLQSGPVVEEKSESETESVVEEVIFHVRVKQKSPPYEMKVKVDDCDVRIRNGRHCPWSRRLQTRDSVEERTLTVQVQTAIVFGRNHKCLGMYARYKTQAVQWSLIVMEGCGPGLLGRDWLKHIVLDWQDIRHLLCTPLQAVLDKHQSVFQDGLGTLKISRPRSTLNPNSIL